MIGETMPAAMGLRSNTGPLMVAHTEVVSVMPASWSAGTSTFR